MPNGGPHLGDYYSQRNLTPEELKQERHLEILAQLQWRRIKLEELLLSQKSNRFDIELQMRIQEEIEYQQESINLYEKALKDFE